LTTELVKRGGKRVTQNPTENPREKVAKGSESERMTNRREDRTSPLGLMGLPKRDRIRGRRLFSRLVFIPITNPAESTTLRSRKTDARNGVTGVQALPANRMVKVREQAVSRKPRVGRIVREANARGKAAGYADAGTAVWNVEERVGVNKS